MLGDPQLAFGVGVTAYAEVVFQRASLGVAGVEAQRRFGTTAAVLSLFSALQLAVHASLQIPVGVVFDPFPRAAARVYRRRREERGDRE